MKKIIVFIAFGIIVSACSSSSMPFLQAQPAVPTDCASTVITDADVDVTLQYGEKLFTEADWKRTFYTVQTDQVYVSREHKTISAIAFVDRMVLCDASTELKNYANEKNIGIMLANYEKYTPVDSCDKNGTLLFQFTALNGGLEYKINLWLTLIDGHPHNALEVMLVFPKNDLKMMDTYAQEFFPDLSSCK